MIKRGEALRVDMQKDLSNAAQHRGPGQASLAGSLGVFVVLLAVLAVTSYPRVAVGATTGVVVTMMLRRWYVRVDTPGAPVPAEGDSERARSGQPDAGLANGQR